MRKNVSQSDKSYTVRRETKINNDKNNFRKKKSISYKNQHYIKSKVVKPFFNIDLYNFFTYYDSFNYSAYKSI